MKKTNRLILTIICLFVVLLSTTLFISFSSNTNIQEIIVKSITPVYDSNSTIEVDRDNVVFNDKNQTVEYKVVIENTQNYDVKITDIALSTPTEKFLTYEVEDINEDDVLGANSTKELIISLETTGIKGWGRNFNDELTANISFEKVSKNELVDHPKEEENNEDVETPKEEIKQPEKPAETIQDIINKTEKIKVTKVTKNTIEFKKDVKVEEGQKIAVWIYSEPIFLGYFDVVETNGVKQIIGLEEALKEADIKSGVHHIVLTTEENETIGYVEVYVDEKQQVSEEKTSTEDDGKIENPYTSTGWLVIYVTIAGAAVIGIVVLRNKKVNKYFILVVLLSSTLSFVKAEETIELPITLNVSFKSQNVMKPSGWELDEENGDFLSMGVDYWAYAPQIKNFYIQNEITEIEEYEYEFDVTNDQNGRVKAYLVEYNDNYACTDFEMNDAQCYNLYLQADGIIYPNENASFYFAFMEHSESINVLDGMDTSNVTDMSYMFYETGVVSTKFTLDVSNFDTSNVTNMSFMFDGTGYNSTNFTLDLGDKFDTGNVTNMSYMFNDTGYSSTAFILDLGNNFDTSNVTNMNSMFRNTSANNPTFTLDVSNFDTSKVTDMSDMFFGTGYYSEKFTLDVSNFDTSKVTDMSSMFTGTGYSNPTFTLDVSNFDTSNVTDMSYMFNETGYNSATFILDLSSFDTSKVTDMKGMFWAIGYSSENFTLDVSNFDTSNVTDMRYMFYDTGYNSKKLNTSITISNPNISYANMFNNAVIKKGSQIKVNYTSETELLVDKMIATKSSDSNVVKGNLMVDVDNLAIGDEIHISGEKFNIISQTDDTITLLAQYNLSPDYKQSTEVNSVQFSDTAGWEYTPGPKEIDIQEWSTNPKTYVNEYVEYLKEELNDDSVTGDLITLKELETLGCTVPSDYATAGETNAKTCTNSPYKSWLINNQLWWTRSASSENDSNVWFMNPIGNLYNYGYDYHSEVRPVITISKEALKKYLKA